MTLNGVMAVRPTLRYITEFGKHTFQHIPPRRSVAEFMHESIVFCSRPTCTMSSYRKFTFAISSPDEFLVSYDNSHDEQLEEFLFC